VLLYIPPILIAEDALRAPSTANPPYDMHIALILHGCVIMVFGLLVFLLRAKQARREIDESMMKNNTFLGSATLGITSTAECGDKHRPSREETLVIPTTNDTKAGAGGHAQEKDQDHQIDGSPRASTKVRFTNMMTNC